MVGRGHKELRKAIRQYCSYLGESNIPLSDFFIESTYLSGQNKELPCYLITKQCCEMVANKLTGKKSVLFTATYVNKLTEWKVPSNRFSPTLFFFIDPRYQIGWFTQKASEMHLLRSPGRLLSNTPASECLAEINSSSRF